MKRYGFFFLTFLAFAALAAWILTGEGHSPVSAPSPDAGQQEARSEAQSVAQGQVQEATGAQTQEQAQERQPSQSEGPSPFRVSGQVIGGQPGLHVRLVARSHSYPSRASDSTLSMDSLTRHELKLVEAEGDFLFEREWNAQDALFDWWVEVGLPSEGDNIESYGEPGMIVTGQSTPFVVQEDASEVTLVLESTPPVELEVPIEDWHVIGVDTVLVGLTLRETYENWPAQVSAVVECDEEPTTVVLRFSPFHAGKQLRVTAESASAALDQSESSFSPWLVAEPGRTLLEPLRPRAMGAIEVFLPSDRNFLKTPGRSVGQKDFRLSLRRLNAESREYQPWPSEWSLPNEDLAYDPAFGLRRAPQTSWNGDTVVGRIASVSPGSYELSVFDYNTRRHSTTVQVEVPPFAVARTDVRWLTERSQRIQIAPEPLHASHDEYVLQTWTMDAQGGRRTALGGIMNQAPRGLDLPADAVQVGTVSVWNGTPAERQAATSLHYYTNTVDALEEQLAGPAQAPYPVLPLTKSTGVHRVRLKDDTAIAEGSDMRLVGLDGQIDSAGIAFFIAQWRDLDLHGFPSGRYRLLRAPQDRHLSNEPFQVWAEFTVTSPGQ